MIQKVIQVGNSLALTIPKSFADKANFKAGDEIFVQQEPDTKTLIITTKDQAKKMMFGPDLFAWLNAIEKKYATAIKDLAQK